MKEEEAVAVAVVVGVERVASCQRCWMTPGAAEMRSGRRGSSLNSP